MKVLQPELAAERDGAPPLRARGAALLRARQPEHRRRSTTSGKSDGLYYIVMQYVEGPTLKELHWRPAARDASCPLDRDPDRGRARGRSRQRHRPPRHQALERHCDVSRPGEGPRLRPRQAAGRPAARAASADDSLTDVGVPYGSLGYGSPEQAQGESADHRTDVFSLGVVLYEMVTGQPAVPASTPLRSDPERRASPGPRARCPGSTRGRPRRCSAILDRAMAKDPARPLPDDGRLPRRAQGARCAGSRRETGAGRPRPRRAPRTARARPWPPGRAASGACSAACAGAGRRREPRPSPEARRCPPAPRLVGHGDQAHDRRAALPQPLRRPARRLLRVLARRRASSPSWPRCARSWCGRPSYIAPYVGLTVDPRQVRRGPGGAGWCSPAASSARPDRLRVTAQLVATASGEILWSDKVDVPAQDLITVQDKIAERVVAGLRLHPHRRRSRRRSSSRPTRSAEAYEFYLRGRDLLFRYVLRTLDVERPRARAQDVPRGDRPRPRLRAPPTPRSARCYVLHAQGYGGDEYYHARRALLAPRSASSSPPIVDARLQMRLRGPAPGRQGAGQGDHRRAAARAARTTRPCSSWRPCSTGSTASTSARSRTTTTCWR